MIMRITPSEYGGLVAPPPGQILHRNQVPRSWRVLTVCSGILLLVGCLMLAIVFGNSNESTHINEDITTTIALLFIGIAHFSSIGIAFFYRHQQLFLLRSLFIPFMIINLLALFNILLNIFARNLLPLSALRVVAISVPSGSFLLYGCAALIIYLEYGSAGDRKTEDGTPLLSDEEMQRRQLARLLEDRPALAPSPDIVHSTFRLEIPTLEPVQKTWTREPSLSAPWYPNSKSQWTSVSQSII